MLLIVTTGGGEVGTLACLGVDLKVEVWLAARVELL